MSDNVKQQVSDATWLWLSDPKVDEILAAAYEEDDDYDKLIEKKVFTEEEAYKIRKLDYYINQDCQEFLKTVFNNLKADKGVNIADSKKWKNNEAGYCTAVNIVRTSKKVRLKLFIDFNPAEDDNGILSVPYLGCWFWADVNSAGNAKLKNICKKKFGNDYEDPYELYDARYNYAYSDIPLQREDTVADITAKVQEYFDKYVNGLKEEILSL